MKKIFTKIIKSFFLFVGLLLIVTITAIMWPLPTIEPPQNHSAILIKSIALIDVETGQILNLSLIHISEPTRPY